MTMLKHGNTFFAGDVVVRKGTTDNITGALKGKIVERTSSGQPDGTVRVLWSDGDESDELPDDLLASS